MNKKQIEKKSEKKFAEQINTFCDELINIKNQFKVS